MYNIPTIETFSWQPPVISLLNTPPVSPTKGDRYLIGIGTDDWLNKDNNITWYNGSDWIFIPPIEGMLIINLYNGKIFFYLNSNWIIKELLGINQVFTGTITLPKTTEIQDTSADHQYVLAVNELTADRTITLPLLTGNDEFVFKDHAQTLTNKTLGTTQLGENSLLLDETLSADEKWSGITTKGTAGATLAVGDICYLA